MIQGELSIFISLIIILAGIFYLSKLKSRIVKLVFSVIPPLLFCYFLPSLLVEQGIIVTGNVDLNGTLAKTLLPFCIFYFTLGLPLVKLKAIGQKPIILFLVGALGDIIGGPISLLISHYFFPTEFNADEFSSMLYAYTWKLVLNRIIREPIPDRTQLNRDDAQPCIGNRKIKIPPSHHQIPLE